MYQDTKETWLESWRYTWFWKDIREECFPFLFQNNPKQEYSGAVDDTVFFRNH